VPVGLLPGLVVHHTGHFRSSGFHVEVGLSVVSGEVERMIAPGQPSPWQINPFRNDYYLPKVYYRRGECCRTLALISQSGLAKSPRALLPRALLAGVGYSSAQAFS